MSRSDYGKPRNSRITEKDDGRRGELGPVLVYLSGYVNPRCREFGHYEDNQGCCHVCGALMNIERYNAS